MEPGRTLVLLAVICLSGLQLAAGTTTVSPGGKATGAAPGVGGAACVDTFLTTDGMSLPGGALVSGVSTSPNCKANCLLVAFTACAGYDFDSSNRCYKFTSAQLAGALRPASGVKHSVRTQCDATTTVAPPTATASGCVDTFKKTTNANQQMGVVQSGVSTKASCEANCLAVTTCTGYDFTSTNECWRHNTKGTINPSTNVDHYERVKCVDPTSGTVCVDTFTLMTGKQIFGGTGAPSYNNNAAGCKQFCLGKPLCTHYEIDSLGACYWHAKPNSPSLVATLATHKLYVRVPCTSATTAASACRDDFTEVKNTFKYDGVSATGVTTLDACKMACLDRTETCVSFDYDGKCFLHNSVSGANPGQPGTGISHYKRVFRCNGTSTGSGSACLDTFVKKANYNRPGGTLSNNVVTQATCEAECLKTKKGDTKACYGFDFNNGDKTCYLQIDQIASQTNPFPGVDTYKRQFVCSLATTTAACMEKYTETKNANAFGGIKKTPTTKATCEMACSATTKGSSYCYGFDFDTPNKGCWFQVKNYTTNAPAVGINNYRRYTDCPKTGVTAGVCAEKYNETANRNAPGGLSAGKNTVDKCKAKCENSTTCYGFDYANGECWTHSLKAYTLNPTTATGVTNYRRLFSCVGVGGSTTASGTVVNGGCQVAFTKKSQVIRYGGTPVADAKTLEACKTACKDETTCLAVNYVRTQSPIKCYRFSQMGSGYPNPDLDLYIKDDNCASKMTTPASMCTMKLTGAGNVQGGTSVNTARTEAACTQYCIETSFCMSVDFDNLVSMCFWFKTKGQTPSGDKCCKHFEKECTGSCVDTYKETKGTGLYGGTEVPNKPTKSQCEAACTESATCEGFDFNKLTTSCYHLTAAVLGTTGNSFNSNDVNHYVRARCGKGTGGRTTLPTTIRTTMCPATYQQSRNKNAPGGKQYGTIGSATAANCQSACTKDDTCVGFDFDTGAKGCFLLTATPALRDAPGVNHYDKTPCDSKTPAPGPITPAPGSQPTPSPTSCNLDLSFILHSSVGTQTYARYEREVMVNVLNNMNYGGSTLRLSTRRYADTSEKIIPFNLAGQRTRDSVRGVLNGINVNGAYGQTGNNLGLALSRFVSDPSGASSEMADSNIPIPGYRQIVLVIMSFLRGLIPPPQSVIDKLTGRVTSILYVPLDAASHSVTGSLRAQILSNSGFNSVETARLIVSKIRELNMRCISTRTARSG